MPNTLCTNIAAIIVTYNPDIQTLQTSLSAVLSQAGYVIVVDNGSSNEIHETIQSLEQRTTKKIIFLALDKNYGLGHAYNEGIGIARQQHVDFVLLMDQDSIPDIGMLACLKNAYQTLTSQDKQVGAVGARYRNNSTQTKSHFTRVTAFGLKKLDCTKEKNNCIHTDFLISSGTLIPLSVLDTVGEMDSGLFIDHIDTEWCFRAKSKGFNLYGDCNAIMQHSLGERQTRIWLGRWRTISFHQPFRYYYLFRNSVLLWQRPYMPANWKRADQLRTLYFLFFYSLFSPNRYMNFRMMLKGFMDGLKGKTGKLQTAQNKL